MTFCLKNYIGIQDDRHRLIDHDHRLNEKIADLQFIVQPQFCAIDAIIGGEGRMLTPKPFPLGLFDHGKQPACARRGVLPISFRPIRAAWRICSLQKIAALAPPICRKLMSLAT